MPKPKSKKRKGRGFCIFAFGQKKMKGINKRSVESALMRMFSDHDGDRVPDLCYLVLGNVRETEKIVYAYARRHHIPVALVPSDFEKFSISAEHLRNGVALKFFKPSKVLMVHLDPEEEPTARSVLTWAKHNNAQVVRVPKPVEKEK